MALTQPISRTCHFLTPERYSEIRAIMAMNVPDIKSKWVGESEKNIQNIILQEMENLDG